MKGQKLVKAQKKQQREEARRLREEEEARLQAEREEQERLERDRKQREVEKLESKDLERREDELNDLRHLLEERNTAVTKWKRDAAEAARWERYMRCDGFPDPEEQREINTFISLWRDDPELDIREVFKKCHIALKLVEELESLLKESPDPTKTLIYQESLLHLQEVIDSKLNLSCEELVKKTNQNMETVVQDTMMTLCLWANLKKSPSFKGLNFKDVGLSFQLPKQLVESDVIVRILYTRYDHLTMLSRVTHPRSPTARRRFNRLSSQKKSTFIDTCIDPLSDLSGLGSLARIKDILKNSALQEAQKDDDTQRAKEVQSRESRRTEASVALQPTQTVCGVQVVDLMEFTPLGGVFCYGLFQLPPLPQKAGKWMMQQDLGSGLEVFPHPTADDPCSVGVSVNLPDSVVFFQPPHVARWDAADTQWRMDGITDVSFEETKAKISFRMETFQPFVLMQKTYVNLPFQSWELRPLGQDSARFSVSGPLFNLSITVQGKECMLQLQEDRGLHHVVGRWMSRPALQTAMFSAGINIFVEEYADAYVSSLDKDPLVERAAYEQMALSASSCAFSWSKWNGECGSERLVLKVCEHHDPGPVPEGSWSLYLLGAQRSQKLELTENSRTFSSDHYPGSEFHSTFFHMLQDNMSPDGIAKSRNSHYLFVNTVQELLWATRPLVYSGPGGAPVLQRQAQTSTPSV
ncbi:dynein axonemal intermediate chain 7 [Nematolebias whitei]|uniref:dynein axonemal intermediate chain 7 n=1 Tax=Nematolebias whitei TaxID=451745 RepID=UPI001898A45C|nr:dynein axonemal intermediate chain 7 [Nematolebias whitei]